MAISIRQWLDNPNDYNTGMVLLAEHMPGSVLVQVLSFGPTQYNREKLYEALQSIYNAQQVGTEAPRTVVPSFVPVGEDADPVIARLKDEWLPEFKRLNFLKGQLPATGDPEKRREMCLEIVRGFTHHIVPIWEKVDHYRRHGHLPEEPVDPLEGIGPLSAAQLHAVKMLQNLPPQISKAKRKGNQDKVAALEVELDRVKTLLGYE